MRQYLLRQRRGRVGRSAPGARAGARCRHAGRLAHRQAHGREGTYTRRSILFYPTPRQRPPLLPSVAKPHVLFLILAEPIQFLPPFLHGPRPPRIITFQNILLSLASPDIAPRACLCGPRGVGTTHCDRRQRMRRTTAHFCLE